jgi:hypothetical protein
MAGVSELAWDRNDALAYVPGMMALLHAGPGSPYRPLPLAAGPICGQCWMRLRTVRPVGWFNCTHGGAP